QRLHRALHVRLDDQRQTQLIALTELGHDVFHPVATLGDQTRLATLGITLPGNILRQTLVFDHDKIIASVGHTRQTEDLHRDRGAGRVDLTAGLVEQRPNAAVLHAADQIIALLELALLHQHRRYRAAALVECGPDDHATGATFGNQIGR